ncbi:MAG: hypothetical protein MHM6MM_001139 [Cercozoa sp. M6MM]
MVARFNGGSNAGHTLVVDGRKFAFHLLPCGLLCKHTRNVVGNGVVLHVQTFFEELSQLDDAGIDYAGRLFVSDRAHLLFDAHRVADGAMEAQRSKKIGTTKRGIGPCYATKMLRTGVRVGELRDWDKFVHKYRRCVQTLQSLTHTSEDWAAFDAEAELAVLKQLRERLLPMVTDTVSLVHAHLADGKSLLAEGANAALLDIDFGTYPFVTSSSATVGGVCTGLGVPPNRIESVVGVVKAYTTRVGAGPFPTEDKGESGDLLRSRGGEYGTTTGRPRRCGWLDLPVLHYSALVNGYSSINLTKLDVLDECEHVKIAVSYSLDGRTLTRGEIPAELDDLARVEVEYETLPGWKTNISNCNSFDELPVNAQRYVTRVEELLGLPVTWIGVGAGRAAMIRNFSAE